MAVMEVILSARNPSAGRKLQAALSRVNKDLITAPGVPPTVPLHVAICHGCDDNVKIILDAGADPNGSPSLPIICFVFR